MNQEPGQPAPPPEESRGAMPFDKDLCSMFRQQAHDAFMKHPELRSVVVVFDYGGTLNDASIDKGIWLGDGGPVKSLDAVLGSLNNTLAMLEVQFVRAMTTNKALRDQAVALGQEVINKRKELTQLEQRIKQLGSDAIEPGTAAGQPGG